MSSADVDSATADWVLEAVTERVEATPDGIQSSQSNVWTSTRRLRSDGRKFSTEFDAEEIEAAIDALQSRGDLVSWFGLLAPANDAHLRALIGNENAADISRATLIEACQALLSTDAGGDGADE